MTNQNFNLVLQTNDPDLALHSWYDKFICTINKHAPLISKRVRKNKQPKWHKNEFADLRQQRDYYHGIKDTENFKKYRNKSTSSIRTSKGNYISEATKSGNNVGELWKHLKDINSVSKCHIKCINIDGKKCDNIEDICNNFNNHFSSVAEGIIKNSNLNASTEKIDNWVSSKVLLENRFSYTCILPEEGLTELLKLNIHKSSGLDGISPNILKMSATVIYESLTHIFNLSLCTGNFLSKLKLARVTPLYKSGDIADMNNYRPISVLPILSKLFEKIVYAHIYEYLIKYKLIHPNQSGFRSKHSCVTALTNIVDHILKEMDQGNYTGVLFLDFKKAFDMVNHTILSSKLKVYKLDDLSLNWFRSYLSERSQKVIINNYE